MYGAAYLQKSSLNVIPNDTSTTDYAQKYTSMLRHKSTLFRVWGLGFGLGRRVSLGL